MVAAAVLSSAKMDWQTPDEVLGLVRALAPIELDVCTVEDNPVRARRYYTPEHNGLAKDWHTYSGVAWMNPPYGRELPKWIDKAIEEHRCCSDIIALVPARTDTKWFDRAFRTSTAVCLWRGRMTFKGAPAPAPFPSALICWSQRDWLWPSFANVFRPHGLIVKGGTE